MQRICFEITDVLWHAYRCNTRVTGIQRVQLNLIRHLAEQHGGDRIRCVFYDWQKKTVNEFDPTDVFEVGEFDGSKLLKKLGLLHARSRLPEKTALKQYLNAYKHNELLRTWRKLQLCVWSIFSPDRLTAIGLRRTCDIYPDLATVPLRRIVNLTSTDSLVFLGAGLLDAAVIEWSHRHRAAGGDVVQMVHDLIPAVLPKFCTPQGVADFDEWLKAAIRLGPRYICVSQSTARDLRRMNGLSVGPDNSCVIPLAHEFEGFARNAMVSSPQSVAAIQGEFVLCVGTIEIRKNGAALLRCWAQLHKELGERTPTLVFAGKHGWLTAEFDDLLKADATGKVHVIAAPTDEALAALYSHCLFTVFPSFYEGWGLPVGESTWFGKYCIASNTSSLPEVCGDLIDYIDPANERSILDALRKAIADKEYRHHRERVIKEATLRTWRQVADAVFSFITQR